MEKLTRYWPIIVTLGSLLTFGASAQSSIVDHTRRIEKLESSAEILEDVRDRIIRIETVLEVEKRLADKK